MLPEKEKIIDEMNRILDDRLDQLRQSIQDLEQSQESETKSSAGDKYETGREMVQLELGKYQGQVEKALAQKKALAQINPQHQYDEVSIGSLVKTNQGIYFISTALGKIQVRDTICFAISLASPIGQVLNGSKAGQSVSFQAKTIRIVSVQ